MVRVKGASNLRSDEAILEMSNFYKREREEIRMSNSPECTGVNGEALQLLQCFFYSKSRKKPASILQDLHALLHVNN